MAKRKKQATKTTGATWKKDSQRLKLDFDSAPARSRFVSNILLPIGVLLAFTLLVFATVWLISHRKVADDVVEYLPEPIRPNLEISGNVGLPIDVIEDIVFETVEGELATVNVFTLKENLESWGQIRSVEIVKDFPDTLKIKIVERQPTLMLATADESNEVEFWGIDEKGIVFKPFDADRVKALKLPYLRCGEIAKVVDGETSIAGVDKIHFISELLKRNAYPVYEDIRMFSLADYGEGVAELGAVITTQGRKIERIIFGVEDFEYQVVKLIGVLSVSGRIKLDKKEIDLSYSDDAIVR